ncbi:MAG: glutathione peroxidase [Alphaproteobacteria bacterium]|nr:glutathione peroxidase [Alphaproteobacteria bacterium]
MTGANAADPLAWDFAFPDIDGGSLKLATFKGKAIMVVNTASFCGFTYQYEALEKLHKTRGAAGFAVIGVPSQDFNQESDSNAKVKAFCETTFGIDFPLAGLSKVKGEDAAPFYKWVKAQRNWEPTWNFNKVVIGRDGRIIACFGSGDEPEGLKVRNAITAALAASA